LLYLPAFTETLELYILSNEQTLSNYCAQTFTILDKWLNQVALEKGQGALSIVKAALHNNLQANVTYYEQVANELEQRGETKLVEKNRLLAYLYKGLLD
jgi:hypothetical protein